jgi:Uma2 family endonuclease
MTEQNFLTVSRSRCELIDGQLCVSPMPDCDHQTVVLELAVRLRSVRPHGFRVFVGPLSVAPNENTEIQPDVLVSRDEDFTEHNLPKGPLLAVEVLTPTCTIKDFHLKKALYERLGTVSYWVIDPIDPTLTVFELDAHGQYQQVAEVEGDDAFETTQPFPVRIVPSELLEG